MNQLAHMALQHQGLCPDKKHGHEDVGHGQSQVRGSHHHHEEVDTRGTQAYPHPPVDGRITFLLTVLLL